MPATALECDPAPGSSVAGAGIGEDAGCWRRSRCSSRSRSSRSTSRSSALFRMVAEGDATLLLDEADTYLGRDVVKQHEDIRGLVERRASPLRGRVPHRDERQEGRAWSPFPAFAPSRSPALDDLPDTIMDRSIVLAMKRRAIAREGDPVSRAARRVGVGRTDPRRPREVGDRHPRRARRGPAGHAGRDLVDRGGRCVGGVDRDRRHGRRGVVGTDPRRRRAR